MCARACAYPVQVNRNELFCLEGSNGWRVRLASFAADFVGVFFLISTVAVHFKSDCLVKSFPPTPARGRAAFKLIFSFLVLFLTHFIFFSV